VQVPNVWTADQRPGWIPSAAASNGYFELKPGEEADPFVALDVSGNARLTRLRLSLEPGVISQTVDWALG
jgi:hypothetical protein